MSSLQIALHIGFQSLWTRNFWKRICLILFKSMSFNFWHCSSCLMNASKDLQTNLHLHRLWGSNWSKICSEIWLNPGFDTIFSNILFCFCCCSTQVLEIKNKMVKRVNYRSMTALWTPKWYWKRLRDINFTDFRNLTAVESDRSENIAPIL